MKYFSVVAILASLALVHGQAADELDSELSALQSRIAAINAEQRRRQTASSPGIVTEDGNMRIRLPRDAHLRVDRQTSIDVNGLADRIQMLEQETVPAVAANARVEAYRAAFNASLTSLDRVNARTDAMVERVAAVDAQVDARLAVLTAGVSTQMSSLAADLTSSINAELQSSITAMTSQARVLTAMASTQAASLDALNTSLQLQVRAAINASREAGGDNFYTQWGRKACTGPSSHIIYHGWAWGSTGSGGGVTPMCLKNAGGLLGGRDVGGRSVDHVVPLGTDHTHYLSGVPATNKNIPCARCASNQTCYLEIGVSGCEAAGYSPAYSGVMLGGHYGHSANNARMCVDTNNQGSSDWGVRSYSQSIYPSIITRGLQSRRGSTSIACHMCCKA